ncbi:MAG: response regulator [Chloroflexi bacterium]|nr:response regulator [Chloroflexota bacterium]
MTIPIRVLAVEDDHDIADMLDMFFRDQGCEFFHASDGQDALALVPRVMPHVILMDLRLPDIDGYHLTIHFRSQPRTAHIPILFVSEWGSREKRLEALELGAADYIVKPFDLHELMLRTQNGVARAARTYLIDERTALPGAFSARRWIDAARTDPHQALLEVALLHTVPYYQLYGEAAVSEVQQKTVRLIIDGVNREADPGDFIGALDEDRYLILTASAYVQAVVNWLTAAFNALLSRWYSPIDFQRGALKINGETFPLMCLSCRITPGERRRE